MNPASDTCPSAYGRVRGALIRASDAIIVAAGVVLITASGCASIETTRATVDATSTAFPLRACASPGEPDCVVRTGFLIDASRQQRGARVLELWDPDVRGGICRHWDGLARTQCANELAALSHHLNPAGRPGADVIGVALEGGGSKAAPFALGVLAGLQEADLLPAHVGAVSSVSGGSYAASFLFNRLLDRHVASIPPGDRAEACRQPSVQPSTAASDYADWFRSCVPDAYAVAGAPLDGLPGLPRCGEKTAPGQGATRRVNEFDPAYRYQGHVWRWPDLLFSDRRSVLKEDNRGRVPELLQTTFLGIASIATVPLELASRAVFRWPINSSPTKDAYRHGIDREFGFSADDWQAALQSPEGPDVIAARRSRARTFGCLGAALAGKREPAWILNASTPAPVSLVDWIITPSRDPLVHSFELTPQGYGAGMYGYATRSPVMKFDLDGFAFRPREMPITEGVVASAAFFDENQSLLSEQPGRLAVGALQLGFNLNWYTEIPNFNAGGVARVVHNLEPYPLWGLPGLAEPAASPYIHLQDGGNSDNTGMFALLRRGYRTIVYAHGTEDGQAKFASLCHLKNILELTEAYRIDSDAFEALVTRKSEAGFATALDQLCSATLDESIRASHGSETPGKASPLSRLYCARLGSREDPERPCAEYRVRFPIDRLAPVGKLPANWKIPEDLFFSQPAGRLEFLVRRGSAGQPRTDGGAGGAAEPFARIIAITPAVDWRDFRTQLDGPDAVVADAQDWMPFCRLAPPRSGIKVRACASPPVDAVARASRASLRLPVPCTAAAYLVANACEPGARRYVRSTGAAAHKFRSPLVAAPSELVHPKFPQDSFIWTTWNSSYLMFAAYFDLGRHYARQAGVALAPGLRASDDVDPSRGDAVGR